MNEEERVEEFLGSPPLLPWLPPTLNTQFNSIQQIFHKHLCKAQCEVPQMQKQNKTIFALKELPFYWNGTKVVNAKYMQNKIK